MCTLTRALQFATLTAHLRLPLPTVQALVQFSSSQEAAAVLAYFTAVPKHLLPTNRAGYDAMAGLEHPLSLSCHLLTDVTPLPTSHTPQLSHPL